MAQIFRSSEAPQNFSGYFTKPSHQWNPKLQPHRWHPLLQIRRLEKINGKITKTQNLKPNTQNELHQTPHRLFQKNQ